MRNNGREFDVVVWGATGFTGALVAEYLHGRYGTDELRWAIAGRSAEKLEQLKRDLGAPALTTILADSFDRKSLDAMCARTSVVLTTVGPYARYGTPLVASCVAQGTHYCDLAGEAQWIRQMIDTHHDEANRTGARIVHCCGFDSVPMDIGVWFLQDECKRRFGSPCVSIAMLVKAAKGGASGGTVASIVNVIKQARQDRSIARVLVNPYGLNPDGERSGPDGRDQQGVVYDEDAQCWTAPFVMAPINTKVVRRSHALLGYAWGEQFSYREAVMTGRGAAGWAKAAAITGGLAALVAGASFSASRSLLERYILPKPGEGPDQEKRESGFFNLRQFGRLPDGTRVQSKITGDRDPGYGSTAKMISEAAVCLAVDGVEVEGGVLTPAAAMAAPLLKRLRENAGLSFEMIDA